MTAPQRPLVSENLTNLSHGQSLGRHRGPLDEGWTDNWTPQRHCAPRLLPRCRHSGLFTITDLGVHDPDLAVHDADPGVHDAPMLLFTMDRSGCSRCSETRTEATRERIAELMTGRYAGLNDCHLTEKLRELEDFEVARESVRRPQPSNPATREHR